MDLIPDEELKPKGFLNLTPMVDFLFLVVAIFATLAVTRTSLFDSEVQLAKVTDADHTQDTSLTNDSSHTVNLSVTEQGEYKWITEFNEYAINSIPTILEELSKQVELGLLPQTQKQTTILLHIDKKAQWDPVIQLLYALKKSGYTVHPVYEEGAF